MCPASIYQVHGRYADAELLYERALVIREKVLMPDHPRVLENLAHLAALYQAMKRDEEVGKLERQVVNPR